MSTAVLERTKYNGDDPMTAGPLEVEAGTVRRYLERCMRDAPDGSRAKDEAKAAYVAFAGVSISARAGRDFSAAVARELGEAEARTAAVMQSVDSAIELWRKAGGDPEALPDKAVLIAWLLGYVATLSRELDRALAIRPAVVRMSDKFNGPDIPLDGKIEEDDEPSTPRKRVRKPRG